MDVSQLIGTERW